MSEEWDGIPLEYQGLMLPEQKEALRRKLDAFSEWRLHALASIPPKGDPRSIVEISLEMHMRRLVTAFCETSGMNHVDQAEIIVCAATNVLGSILMAGCKDLEDMSRRLEAVGVRLGDFADEEMRKGRMQ